MTGLTIGDDFDIAPHHHHSVEHVAIATCSFCRPSGGILIFPPDTDHTTTTRTTTT
jgi:hypothetical protein